MTITVDMHDAGPPQALDYPATTEPPFVTLTTSDFAGNDLTLFFTSRARLLSWLEAAWGAAVALPDPELTDAAVDRRLADVRNEVAYHFAVNEGPS